MTARISLALALHNHQPVGNFGWVIARGLRAGVPADGRGARAPPVRPRRAPLHRAAARLDARRAARRSSTRLRALAERGQVEIMGGGYAEPILASLPERDRVGQLRRMADEVEALFGARPSGAWLAERVWEPDLPDVARGRRLRPGRSSTTRTSGRRPSRRTTCGARTLTEDQGRSITVFGTEQGLRYRIPCRDRRGRHRLPARARHRGRRRASG